MPTRMAEVFEPLNSSHIRQVEYDAVSEDLTVSFTDGRRYMYRNVPRATYRALTQAESTGEAFHRHVRTRYPAEEV